MISMARILGAPGHGTGGEAGAEGVVGRVFGSEAAFHVGHQVHYVGEAFDVHQLGDRHGAGKADPAYVVAAQVDQHDVLGALLLAGLELILQGVVFFGRAASGPGAGDGVGGRDPVFDGDHRLDGGANDVEPVQVQVVHVGRGG